jgi:hypothetical protein
MAAASGGGSIKNISKRTVAVGKDEASRRVNNKARRISGGGDLW